MHNFEGIRLTHTARGGRHVMPSMIHHCRWERPKHTGIYATSKEPCCHSRRCDPHGAAKLHTMELDVSSKHLHCLFRSRSVRAATVLLVFPSCALQEAVLVSTVAPTHVHGDCFGLYLNQVLRRWSILRPLLGDSGMITLFLHKHPMFLASMIGHSF